MNLFSHLATLFISKPNHLDYIIVDSDFGCTDFLDEPFRVSLPIYPFKASFTTDKRLNQREREVERTRMASQATSQ